MLLCYYVVMIHNEIMSKEYCAVSLIVEIRNIEKLFLQLTVAFLRK